MSNVAILPELAARLTKVYVPAANNAAAESMRVKSTGNEMRTPEIQLAAQLKTPAEIEETSSLKVLWNITLGILTYAVMGAIFTLIISR